MKAHKYPQLLSLLFIISLLFSCEKGSDFLDDTSSYPIGWKSIDTFDLIAYNAQDSAYSLFDAGICPLGMVNDANFGKMRSGYYAEFQTTLTSKSFSFKSIDSAVLIIPFYQAIPKYGAADKGFDISIYEMSEMIDTTVNSKKYSYSYNSTALGKLTGYIPNTTDSVGDYFGKTGASIRVPLSLTFANKLIAPGTYADDATFQQILKGLYVRCENTSSTNGYVMINLNASQKIKIYGKDANGGIIYSEFITGGSYTNSVNEYLHDASSMAMSATNSANAITGDVNLYNIGLFGHYNKMKFPNLTEFAKDKIIFKAELSLYTVDTGFSKTPNLGIAYIDSNTNREFALADDYYSQKYLISNNATNIGGSSSIEYKYNIGLFVNEILKGTYKTKMLNIYSSSVFQSNNGLTKFSNFYPSRVVLGGTKNALKPKLKIYYVDKK